MCKEIKRYNTYINVSRDWRGLATLVNISAEIANSFESRDKTAKVIEYWIQKRDGTATVGQLLEYLQRLDRYDAFDDFMDLCFGRRLICKLFTL